MDPLTRRHYLTDCILFVYVISPNKRALKLSIPLLGKYVCFCLLERRLQTDMSDVNGADSPQDSESHTILKGKCNVTQTSPESASRGRL